MPGRDESLNVSAAGAVAFTSEPQGMSYDPSRPPPRCARSIGCLAGLDSAVAGIVSRLGPRWTAPLHNWRSRDTGRRGAVRRVQDRCDR